MGFEVDWHVYLALAAIAMIACFHPAGIWLITLIGIVGTFALALRDIGIIGVLLVLVGCASFLIIMIPVTKFFVKRAARNLEIRKVLAAKRFLLASDNEIHCMAKKLGRGHRLTDFIWDGQRVILLTGIDAQVVAGHGWRSLKRRKPLRLYTAQEKILQFRLALAGATLSRESHHALCVLLYFNWKIVDLTVYPDNNTMAAALRRRGESRIEHYPLQPLR
ncbi:hypothetical protein [Pseudomonas sp. S1(2024)]|uniref:hypothetical protein n=1 Tax=Pseudomonas sp. S1(2024) TaxID=3390191 RepID=UPI00397833FC